VRHRGTQITGLDSYKDWSDEDAGSTVLLVKVLRWAIVGRDPHGLIRHKFSAHEPFRRRSSYVVYFSAWVV
jgi:hypothetical protein